MYGRPKPKPAAARLPAAIGMMADEIDARPFGSSGEFLVPPRPEPRTVAQPFQPPPPDWNAELRERRERAGEAVAIEPAPLVNPVAAMLAEAHALGEIDDSVFPGPPVEYPPLVRPLPPPADWREIEADRQRQKAADAQDALEPEPIPYPAPRGAQKRPRWP